ncbi:hypothetical protein JL721_9467 [Aureococcus anophagefferens]|nr:hypothetical protein JL721_9467 [Aureococcus anophagefferens]
MATPKEVLRHEAPTKNFLCPLSANEYGIEFLSFVIQDYDSKLTIFEVSRDRPLPIDFSMHDAMDPDSLRKINYELSEDFLRLPNISTTLVFSAVYALPPMDNALVSDMIAHPYETSSDSFYFVGDKLIMHNKAFYRYIPEDSNAQCKSYESKYAPAKGEKASAKAESKGAAGAKAEAKGAKSSGGAGAKAQAKGGGDDELWSKERRFRRCRCRRAAGPARASTPPNGAAARPDPGGGRTNGNAHFLGARGVGERCGGGVASRKISNINAPEDLLDALVDDVGHAPVLPRPLGPGRDGVAVRPRPGATTAATSIARPAPCVVSGPVRRASRGSWPRRRRRRRAPPPQTNGASAPPPDAPEARSLSVVASSVMALGVLPGEELKRMLDNFCASLPTIAAVAVNAYDVGLLRSTAKTLLRGAPPKNLAAKVKQILEATPGATIQNAVLRALDTAAAKGAEYDTLRSMMGAGAPSKVEAEADVDQKPDLAGSLKRLFLEKQQDLNGLRGGTREDESEGEVPLEAVLLDVVNELNPELLIALSLDTLAALPPEAYESLSRLLAGAGGVVGGAAAKGSLNILLGGKAGAALGGTTLGAAAKAGVAGAAAFKGLALTSIFYAGKLFLFSDSQPESLDQAWATVAEEAFLSRSCWSPRRSASRPTTAATRATTRRGSARRATGAARPWRRSCWGRTRTSRPRPRR